MARRQAGTGTTAAQARRRYLQMAGGGLVAAYIGSVTKPPEVRNTKAGKPFLVFGTVPDGDRLADESAPSIRVEYLGHDAEALAPRLTKSTQIYAEGSLRLSAWTGRDGVERAGLNIKATHIEILERARQ